MNRGAEPNSPRLTAEVSIVATQPAPISRSACRLEVGSVTSCSRRTPRRISARVASMATPETFARYRKHAAVGDRRKRFIERGGQSHAAILWAEFSARRSGQFCTQPTLEFGAGFGEQRNDAKPCKTNSSPVRSVITAEIAPPASCDPGRSSCQGCAAEGPRRCGQRHRWRRRPRPSRAQSTAAAILLQNGIEPILQFTCRDRNRIALQSDLLAAAALGIENLLLLQGRRPEGRRPARRQGRVRLRHGGADPQAAVAIRDAGELPSGPQGRRQGAVLHGRSRRADRSAGRLGAEKPAGQDRGRQPVRADAVLHGCGHRAPLHGATCRARHQACRS